MNCKYCNEKFRYEHIHKRHETDHCLKRYGDCDNYRELIQETTDRVNKLYDDFNTNSLFDIKEAISEVITDEMHDISTYIAVKNLDRVYHFKCIYCKEGFEYEREQLLHQHDCVYTKFDDTLLTLMETTKQPVKISAKSKSTDVELPTLLDIKNSLDSLTSELSLIVKEIKQLQEGHTKLREQCAIVEKTRGQLENLHDIKFQLELFKAAALKSI